MARALRNFRHMATQTIEECAICGRWIKAGDEYRGEVWVSVTRAFIEGKWWVLARRFWVNKTHLYCPDDWLDEEFEMDEAADMAYKESQQSAELAAAA